MADRTVCAHASVSYTVHTMVRVHNGTAHQMPHPGATGSSICFQTIQHTMAVMISCVRCDPQQLACTGAPICHLAAWIASNLQIVHVPSLAAEQLHATCHPHSTKPKATANKQWQTTTIAQLHCRTYTGEATMGLCKHKLLSRSMEAELQASPLSTEASTLAVHNHPRHSLPPAAMLLLPLCTAICMRLGQALASTSPRTRGLMPTAKPRLLKGYYSTSALYRQTKRLCVAHW